MKKFDIPSSYRSPIIGKVKAKRKLDDPRKQDFSPAILNLGGIDFIISRHFGFCFGVENAIEKSYLAINENPDKRIFLISQMIHNPDVNNDLIDLGIKFIQDTNGDQLIPWEDIDKEDVVIIPAFGTTIEIEKILIQKGVDIKTYNTTCPFVEKVWNRSAKLGDNSFTVIIHGKHNHEETRATFSHSEQNSPSIIVKNLKETNWIIDYINGKLTREQFAILFKGKVSVDFDPDIHLSKIGVVNQTTMLASETQEISEMIKKAMLSKYGLQDLNNHFADTRDTLCYATNDNQSSTIEMLKIEADLAIVVGGYNSSNTTHLVELLEKKFKTYFIRNEKEIDSINQINSFNIHQKKIQRYNTFIEKKDNLRIIITSGASCPDSVVDNVIQRIIELKSGKSNQ